MTPRSRLQIASPLAVALAIAAPRPAAAQPHKLLVLQSEGRADAKLRAKIDAAIFRLASAAEPDSASGELTFADAATAVGCRPDTTACKDEVLGMLGVDEIITSSITPKPGGVEVSVHRIGKGGAAREATMLLATGAPPDKLDGIAPLFGDKPAAASPLAATPPPAPAIAVAPPPSEPPPVVAREPSPIETQPPPAALAPHTDEPQDHRRLEITGMAGGAGLAVIGVVLWTAAASTQNDINNAPTVTKQDLDNLKNLESRGDTYAGLGNALVVSGLIVSGISTYFYLRDRDRPSSVARVTPTLLGHGAGVVLTIGGTP